MSALPVLVGVLLMALAIVSRTYLSNDERKDLLLTDIVVGLTLTRPSNPARKIAVG